MIQMPTGKRIGATALALALGMLLPLIAVLQISMLIPVAMVCGIFAVRLKANGGWVPAAVLIGTSLASTLWFCGATIMLMMLLAAIVPALVTMSGVARKRPFFRQMAASLAAYGAGLLAAMALAYFSFGSGMIARFTDFMRTQFTQMPDSALQPFVEAMNSALALSGSEGTLYTVELYREQLTGILDLMQQTYAQQLPGTLLAGAVLSGVLSVFWGNWAMARQGLATNESFKGMSAWFLPSQITFEALGLLAAGFILANTGYSGGATVYTTASELAGTVFVIQALAALDRRMLRAGRTLTRRRVLLTLMATSALLVRGFGTMLGIVGAWSAMFGSHGAIKRRTNDNDQAGPKGPQE